MTDFKRLSVLESLEASLAVATHLEPKHAATVGAARALAAKIDAWDTIVQWALEDLGEGSGRPAVPQNDNTSLGTYHRYLEHLALTVPAVKVAPAAKPAAPEPDAAPAGPGATISSLQDRAAQRKAR